MARKRKAGEGTLRLRKDGRWEGRVIVDYGPNGRPKTKNVLARTKAECQEKLEKLKAAYGVVTGRAKPDMSFGAWLELWYKTYAQPTLRITTQQNYEDRIYHQIIPGIGDIPLNKLQQSDLQQFYAQLKKNGRVRHVECYGPGRSDRMVRACHTTCRTALEKAVTEGLIPVNPAIGCKLPPKKAAEMKVLRPREEEILMGQAEARQDLGASAEIQTEALRGLGARCRRRFRTDRAECGRTIPVFTILCFFFHNLVTKDCYI